MKDKELRIIKGQNHYTLQRKNMIGVWVYFKRHLQGTGFKVVRDFKTKDIAIDWYIEDYLKTNKKHVKILLTEIDFINS